MMFGKGVAEYEETKSITGSTVCMHRLPLSVFFILNDKDLPADTDRFVDTDIGVFECGV